MKKILDNWIVMMMKAINLKPICLLTKKKKVMFRSIFLKFNDSDFENLNKNIESNDLWILLWIFKFQERFKLSDVTINSLIGFFSLVLKDVDSQRFNKFPST